MYNVNNLKLISVPDPRLFLKSSDITKVDDSVRALMNKMLELMYEERGIGLAAPQVGINQNIIVIDLQEKGSKPIFAANPKIIFASKDKVLFEEGCLSVPGQTCMVERSVKVKVKFLNYHNQEETISADGLLAICLQHEIDHLHGITIQQSKVDEKSLTL
jgi:peptide deformylase